MDYSTRFSVGDTIFYDYSGELKRDCISKISAIITESGMRCSYTFKSSSSWLPDSETFASLDEYERFKSDAAIRQALERIKAAQTEIAKFNDKN